MIPLSVPSISGNEWKYVKDCLDTGWVSSAGKYVELFENQVAEFVKAKHAVACVNGTAALQVAMQVVGVGPGDEVIVPTLTFIATVNAVHYLGAHPVFMDCDDFYNIDTNKVADFLSSETVRKNGSTYNKKTGRRIAAVVPVHVFGNAARLQELIPLCREHHIKVVEDAAESLGTAYTCHELSGRSTGTIGDIGCFSFNGNKIITTGGGGMIVTDNAEYAQKAKYLTTQAKDDEVRYVHEDIGYNFRLTNIQAAVGVAQMELLPEFLRTKKDNYKEYQHQISRINGLSLAECPDYADNNKWMYALKIDSDRYGRNREELMQHLQHAGIQSRPVWYLNHLQKPYRHCTTYRIENAHIFHDETLCLPCSTNLTAADILSVAGRLRHE